ncbi:MAG TPA: tRNA dihydrouridine synthase DusB [Gammaproteobacteria bacterium]|nr:tRNA dihydrouridine synthase DusB [Gammaproteobacteria bacterium]
MQIGPYTLSSRVLLAPMAGITDLPFRRLCRELGAGLAVSEMLTCDPTLRGSRKTRLRMDHTDELAPISVQIAGTDPQRMADTAQFNVDHGAQIIDINMGCPAKKVCNVMAGSALLRDEPRVAQILQAVVNAVAVPVTLKIRTGWDLDTRNATTIARIAEDCGISALAMHGRSRACGFGGEAEYDTMAEVKTRIRIPLIANGDIATPQKAGEVLDYTGADAIMIGRAAQGKPWLFREMNHYLATGKLLPAIGIDEISALLLRHMRELHAFYGAEMGVRIARKHIGWYCKTRPGSEHFRHHINGVEHAEQQLAAVADWFTNNNDKEYLAA